MQIGIDFGTTNTVAAIIGPDGKPVVLPLDPETPESGTLRTLLYVERDGLIHIGSEAMRLHRDQNVGRIPRFAKAWVGVIDIEMGDAVVKGYEIKGGAMSVEVFADVDADAPGRLLHSLKSPLATEYAGTKVFDHDYTLEELIAEFLVRVRERIETLTGNSVREAVFGRPVVFAGAHLDADNQRAQERLGHAAELAGFTRVVFEQEPIAAGLAFGASRALAQDALAQDAQDARALVFDFGGGTLDIAVLQMSVDGSQQVLATGGVAIAGDHFDQTLFRRAILPWLGERVKWGPQRLDMPTHLMDALGDWQDVVTLCNAPTLAHLRQIHADCTSPIRILALEDFIFKGYAFDLYSRIEQCKRELSAQRFAVTAFDKEAISIWQPVTRGQFEAYIARDGRAIRDMVQETIDRAGLSVDQIDYVIRTGGSSSIPYFVDMLSQMFGKARLTESDLFTSVASGLAVRASQL